MKKRIGVLMLLLASMHGVSHAQVGESCTTSTGTVPPVMVHNPGNIGDCIEVPCQQDADIDLYEYYDFLDDYWFTGHATPRMTVVDGFYCSQQGEPHGNVVKSFAGITSYQASLGTNIGEKDVNGDLEQALADLTLTAAPGAVINASNGSLDIRVLRSYADEIATLYDDRNALTFIAVMIPEYEDKAMSVLGIDPGQVPGISGATANLPRVFAYTHWNNQISRPSDPFSRTSHHDVNPAYSEGNSFSLPSVAGVASVISAIVKERDGADPGKVFDYLVSSCDRPDDAAAPFTLRAPDPNDPIPGHAPWSDRWAYGIFSAWKAMVFALGYGELASTDSALDPVADVETVFSDAFELRGDLFVPAGQAFRVDDLGSIAVCENGGVACAPEGPTSLGNDPTRQEIRIAGTTTFEGAVSASVSIDGGGKLIVADGGSLTIAAGQTLTVAATGELEIQPGGTLTILAGAEATLAGIHTFDGNATLSGTLDLEADLFIGSDAQLFLNPGSLTRVADSDAAGSGNNGAEVEIVVNGHLAANGAVIRSSGTGDWAGITIDSQYPLPYYSVLIATEVRDAILAVDAMGSHGTVISASQFIGNGTAVRLTDRDGDYFTYNTVRDGTSGLVLVDSDPQVRENAFDDLVQGVFCSAGSRPVIRNNDFSSLTSAVGTGDSSSRPNLGVGSDPGHNNFDASNTYNLTLVEPLQDVHAEGNWWGSVKVAVIESKFIIATSDPQNSGQIQYVPFLTSPWP